MTAVENPYSQPQLVFRLDHSSAGHGPHLSSPEHLFIEQESAECDGATETSHGQLHSGHSYSTTQAGNTNEYHHTTMAHQSGLYTSQPDVESPPPQFQHSPSQQAWQQAYHGKLLAATPSFEDSRSSTSLLSNAHNNSQIRSTSATSATSNNIPSSASDSSNPTFHPYRRQPGNMKRSRSIENGLSTTSRPLETATAAAAILPNHQNRLAPSITSPSDTIVQTPNTTTTEQYRERPRVESNGSTDSRSTVSERGKVAVAVRAGRIPVPQLMDVSEGIQATQGGQRSIFDPVAQSHQRETRTAGGGFDRPSSNVDLANQHLSSSSQFSHKRQSSSTSSVGAIVRPTLGHGSHSSLGTGASASTPPSLVIASSSLTTPLAPIVSPERPVRTRSDIPTMSESKDKTESGAASSSNSGGLKGRLQRALNRTSEKEKPRASLSVISAPVGEPRRGGLTASGSAPSATQHTPPTESVTTPRSVSNPQQAQQQQHPGLGNRRPSNSSFAAPSFIEPLNGHAGKGKRSLFSMRNASTDNISIGSTVSSASMMIRKMVLVEDANPASVAESFSMAGISKIFKNKDDEDGIIVPEPKAGDDSTGLKGDKKKKKKNLFGGSSKSQPATSSTTFETANGAAVDDLTPAAKLARQHTLRTKADEARRAAAAAARAARQLPPKAAYGDESTVRRTENGPSVEAPEDYDVDQVAAQLSQFSLAPDNNVPDVHTAADTEQYGDASEGLEDDEGLYMSDEDAASFGEDRSDDEGEYVWGRSYRDRHAIPTRGILKRKSRFSFSCLQTGDTNATTRYVLIGASTLTIAENSRLVPQQWPRLRATNSTENLDRSEPGRLSKIPSQDPDYLDGKSNNNRYASTYDPFSQSFSPFDSQIDREPFADRLNFPYANFALNSSAPVLTSTTLNFPNGGKPQRSLTTLPVQKRNINWAPECAIYHTFHAEVYDRRSEPATCNRLTPQLAQQIKDELNGYKMEEMDVHPSSRIHTHFL
ncbi:hypothetical protein QFC19_001485 [Naganishia cerealis]|uniref:Uncharacterized protein n=1 Tax=Naganishia cerealis TaxID=610337 RepID=A0ACC2WHT1_9TREE|nr:hypothetical protein QFC19_001485 [Naganishia cerealis]